MKFELIESIRKKKGLTQAELAKMIDFSTTGYQKMIYVGDIKVTVLEKIAQILGIDIMVFFNKTTTKTYRAIDMETAAKDAEEAYERANHYQKELLGCYKTISNLQAQILIASPDKTKKIRVEVKPGPKPKFATSTKPTVKKTKAKGRVKVSPKPKKAKAAKKRK